MNDVDTHCRFLRRKHPILVTGANRSGTTWVGRMLSLAPGIRYVEEPFNRKSLPPNYRLLPCPFTHHFHHVLPRERRDAVRYLLYRMDCLHPWRRHLRAAPGPRGFVEASRRWIECRHARGQAARPLIKDPIALMSAEWLADALGAAVVVMIRHPAAYAASIKALGWRWDPAGILEQRELVEAHLAPLEPEIRAHAARHGGDPVAEAALRWKICYHVVLNYRRRYPDWTFVRHEDLCRDPVAGFRQLYATLGLSLSAPIEREIERHSAAGNPIDAGGDVHGIARDSRALVGQWKGTLTDSEVATIRAITQSVAAEFYAEQDW